MSQTLPPPAPRRALVLIDVQNEYFDGCLRIDHPDPAHSLANICRAAQAAQAAGIPLVVVQQVAPETSPVFARGSHGFALHPEIAALSAALHVEKALPSSFTGTGLEAWLRETGIDTLTVCGYMTHNCINSTIVDAVHRGWKVEFLSDASGSLPYENVAGRMSGEQAHRVFSVVFQSRFAAVMTTQGWLDVLAGQTVPVRDNIPASHARAATGGVNNVVEIVKWKSLPGIADQVVIDAALGLAPDLRSIGGFIDKTLYKNGDEWVDIYYWQTIEDAYLSNERMAGKECLEKLLSLLQPESISIAVMSKV